MDGSISPDNRIQLPPDDGLVEQTLLELDAKLDAWAETILRTQALAREYVESQFEAVAEQDETAASDLTDDSTSGGFDLDKILAGSSSATRTTDFSDDTNKTAEAFENSPLNEEKVPADPAPTAEASFSLDSEMETIAEDTSDKSAETEEYTRQKEDDEALLATLEPDVLKKVQVLRRINHQKSVRELVDQVQASTSANPAEDAKAKKGFFWRKR
jgi:hypothetical protein